MIWPTLLLFAVLQGWIALAAHGQEIPPRLALAHAITSNPAAREERQALAAVLTDAMARSLFKRMGIDRGWGPEEAKWIRRFPEFNAAYQGYARGQEPDMEARLAESLAKNLAEADLESLANLYSDPALAEVHTLLRQYGLDSITVTRQQLMNANPYHYTRAERDREREQLTQWKRDQDSQPDLKQRLVDGMKIWRTSARLRYQKLLIDELNGSLVRLEREEPAKLHFRGFLLQWRTKLNLE